MNHPFSDRIEVSDFIGNCGTQTMHAYIGVGRTMIFSSG